MTLLIASSCEGTPQRTTTESLLLYSRAGADGSIGGGIVNLSSDEVVVLPDGQNPIGWSPSRADLLLYYVGDNRLVVSGTRGDDQRTIFQVEEGLLLDARWLTHDTVLVSVGESSVPPSPLHTYAVSVGSGEVTLLQPDVPRYLQAVAPDGSFWVEALYPRLEVVRLDGSRQELEVGIPIGYIPWDTASKPSIAILPNGEEFAFVSCHETDASATPCALYIARVFGSSGDIPRRLPDHRDNVGIESLRVSPDGRLLAYISIHDSSIVVINLTHTSDPVVIPWGQTTNAPFFVWSPTGTSLCTGFFDPTRKEFVLETIDTESGERMVILSDPASLYIPVDWAMLGPGG
jgi:WD40 repeat protein